MSYCGMKKKKKIGIDILYTYITQAPEFVALYNLSDLSSHRVTHLLVRIEC